MTDGMTVMALSASLQHKWCQGLSIPNCVKPKNIMYVKAKLCKKKSCKMRPACTHRKEGMLEKENHKYIVT